MTRADILRNRIATGELTLASAARVDPKLTEAVLRQVLEDVDWNRTDAAEVLGVTYSTLARVIRKHLPTLRNELDGDPARSGGGWRPGHEARRIPGETRAAHRRRLRVRAL